MRALATPRLHLRPLADGDEALYCLLYVDPDVMRHVAPPLGPDAASRSFRAARRDSGPGVTPRHTWVLHETATLADIGLIALVGTAAGSAELGVLLLPDRQGRGYATEAIEALIPHAFGPLGLAEVHTRHAPGNGLAEGLMIRLGFEPLTTNPGEPGVRDRRWRLDAREARSEA
jgi:RimJ/RimL family protein N-acetyltransferase